VLFVVLKNKGRRRNGGGREKSLSPSHKLNITNGFTNEITYR
jgi:hypothetical protein